MVEASCFMSPTWGLPNAFSTTEKLPEMGGEGEADKNKFCFCPSQTPIQSYSTQHGHAQTLTFKCWHFVLYPCKNASLPRPGLQPSLPLMQHCSTSCADSDGSVQQEALPHQCTGYTASLPVRQLCGFSTHATAQVQVTLFHYYSPLNIPPF